MVTPGAKAHIPISVPGRSATPCWMPLQQQRIRNSGKKCRNCESESMGVREDRSVPAPPYSYIHIHINMKIYLNGQLVAKEDAKISVFDHGFLYGDGVFEGMRVYGGRIFRLGAHLERLYRSARAILLQPPSSMDEMGQAIIDKIGRA